MFTKGTGEVVLSTIIIVINWFQFGQTKLPC